MMLTILHHFLLVLFLIIFQYLLLLEQCQQICLVGEVVGQVHLLGVGATLVLHQFTVGTIFCSLRLLREIDVFFVK